MAGAQVEPRAATTAEAHSKGGVSDVEDAGEGAVKLPSIINAGRARYIMAGLPMALDLGMLGVHRPAV